MIVRRLFPVVLLVLAGCVSVSSLRGTGDLGLVVERASGSVMLIDTSTRSSYATVTGLGDLSHATAVYSRDGRYAYVFGRDGGLTKVDMLRARIAARVVQAGNSIGGAISQDGRVIAVANYEPGGVRLFDSATLAPLADIPTTYGDGTHRSKVVGIADAPGERFIFSLYDADEIWIADCSDPRHPVVSKFGHVGRQPYDGLITRDGRWYLAGLFGEDGVALLDLWHPEQGVRRILDGYGKGAEPLPVYKMPHLEGWGFYGHYAFVPAVGHHEVLVIDTDMRRPRVHQALELLGRVLGGAVDQLRAPRLQPDLGQDAQGEFVYTRAFIGRDHGCAARDSNGPQRRERVSHRPRSHRHLGFLGGRASGDCDRDELRAEDL
mgnify:CR=1 FL=1